MVDAVDAVTEGVGGGGMCHIFERLMLARKPSVSAADTKRDVQDCLVVTLTKDLISKACPCSIDQTVVIKPPPPEMNSFLLMTVSQNTTVSVCVFSCIPAPNYKAL